MSGKSKEMQPICPKCGKYPFVIVQHECSAKEPLDGSPLESVVQGRSESPVPSNPAVQGTPDILAEIRARVIVLGNSAYSAYSFAIKHERKRAEIEKRGSLDAYRKIMNILDELSPPSDNTAPDTTSGSAGVP